MAQLEQLQRHGDSETTIAHEPKKITTHPSSTMEHYLRGEVLTSSSPSSSPSSTSPVGHHDHEDEHGHHHKKSVLTKVKEKAKKLRHSLSNKKKHSEGDSTPTSWGASSMNEHEDEEQDAEYLGAPMYESEQAPEAYKETAKLHPRAVPVISEKHVLPSSVNPGSEQDKEKPPSPNKNVTETAAVKFLSPIVTAPRIAATKPPSPGKSNEIAKPPSPGKSNEIAKTPSPKKTITETVTDKLGPAYATVSNTTHAIASKIEGLTVSAPAAVSDATQAIAAKVGLSAAAPAPSENNKAPEAPPTISTSLTPQHPSSRAAPQTLAASEARQPLSAPAAPGMQAGSTFTNDKGVSVKEYLIQKFEPGEDERALSRVISDAVSPRRTPGNNVGMVGKVKGAITSLLWHEEPSKTTNPESAMASSPHAQSAMMTSSPRIPVSTNAYEAVEEENKGRILQTN